MGELTNKVGRDDNARLAYLKQAGWGKPINMYCKNMKVPSKAYKDGWDRIWGTKESKDDGSTKGGN